LKKKLLRALVAIIAFLICIWGLTNLINSFRENVDSDRDGLSDNFEKNIGTNPSNEDTDMDEFRDGDEYEYWTNRANNENDSSLEPNGDIDSDSIINILDRDSDNDGLSDGYEIYTGTDPADPDSDDDGTPDGNDPSPGGSSGEGGLTYGDQGSAGGGSLIPSSLIRDGYGGSPVCYAIFNPSLTRMKRYTAYDSVTVDYSAYVYDTTKYPLPLSNKHYDNVFEGTLILNRVTYDYLQIPSVSPNANIISYNTYPEIGNIEFFKDGADNYYIKSEQYTNWKVTFYFTTSANSSYYKFEIPEDLTLTDVPDSVKHTPPPEVLPKAEIIIDELGLTGETNIKRIAYILYNYFSSFTEGEIPSQQEEPDTYLAVARAKHGACYVRSFAFFITANAIGLPTRLVVNECHAFVEIYIPTQGWKQLDLGGLGTCQTCNPSEYPEFTNSTGPGVYIPGLKQTKTEITKLTSSVYKPGYFDVEGYVRDKEDKGIKNINVKIYVTKTKDSLGYYAGGGKTKENGIFQINCKVPDKTEVGENHVIAFAIGNENYSDSNSDPTIEIFSNTTIKLTVVQSVGLGDRLNITGYLVDAGGKRLTDKTIKIYWDAQEIGQTNADSNGEFNYGYTPSSLGSFNISVIFSGETYLSASQDYKILTVKDKRTYLYITITPTTTKRGTQIKIQGNLSSESEGYLPNEIINIFYNENLTKNTTSSLQGEFQINIDVPKNSPLGNISVKARYPGDDVYAEANDEKEILVKADTKISLNSLTGKNIALNKTILISGILTDNIDQPLENYTISINWRSYKVNVTTNNSGIFGMNYTIPLTASFGSSTLSARFEGKEYYLPSESILQINIIEPGTKDEESKNTYILLAIAIGVFAIIIGVIMLFKKHQNEEKPNIEDIATKTIIKLKTDYDHRKTVINCYKQLCEWLSSKGVRKDSYQTPREFAIAAKDYIKMSPQSLYTLTQIFEKARYSTHEIDSDDRDKAITCLKEIVSAPVDNGINEQPLKEEGK